MAERKQAQMALRSRSRVVCIKSSHTDIVHAMVVQLAPDDS